MTPARGARGYRRSGLPATWTLSVRSSHPTSTAAGERRSGLESQSVCRRTGCCNGRGRWAEDDAGAIPEVDELHVDPSAADELRQ